jgi:CheY-like chemotaxis protein
VKLKKLRAPAGKPLRIAVIEEDGESLYSIRFILQSLGYQAQSFLPNTMLAAALQRFAPDLVVIDLTMPGGIGLAVLRQLKSGPLRATQMLAVTAEANPFSDSQIRQAGADRILHKPYTVSELQEQLVVS